MMEFGYCVCDECNVEMIPQRIDTLDILSGRQGIEYTCPKCGKTEFEGKVA